MKSLSKRLTLYYGISAFVILLISSLYLYWFLNSTINRQDEEIITDRLRTIRLLLAEDANHKQEIKDRIENEWTKRKFEHIYVRILDQNQQLITETPNLQSQHSDIIALFERERESLARLGHSVKYTFNDTVFKVRVENIDVDPTEHTKIYSVQLALDRSGADHLINAYKRSLVFVILGFFVICLIVGYRIAKRALAPINKISEIARRVNSASLDERVSLTRLPEEFGNLANTLNDMLERLRDSFLRLSQFSSDIAHELRTPINNISGQISVALGRERSVAEYKQVLSSCLEECQRIARITDALLFIARVENDPKVIESQSLDLRVELELIQNFYETSASEAGLTIRLNAPEALKIQMDKILFKRAIGNLLSNAIKYSFPGGEIVISAFVENQKPVIEVSDSGMGIPADQLQRVFDRFYRVDHSRSQKIAGVGLGLAIVKSIAVLSGGSVAIRSEVAKGTSVRIELPLV
jgi:two-component system heavy metal sensor histidine kinase CusS